MALSMKKIQKSFSEIDYSSLFANNVKYLAKAQELGEDAVDAVFPIIKEAERYYKIYEEKTEQYTGLTQCITGFVMMFFGGFFMTTIACYEAVNQSGGEQLWYNLDKLRGQAIKVADANKKDDLRDDDGDGIADVKQITESELGRRKFLLFLTACDPGVVNEALHGLYLILLAVAATLRSQFARVISIGSSIGDVIEKSFAKFVLPQLEEQTPDEYKSWMKYVGVYLSRFIAVAISFRIQTYLATVHSAYKGAREFVEGLNSLAKSQGKGYLTEGYFDEALAFLLAVAGVYLQLVFWSELPAVIKILFFPAFFLEGVLKALVSPLMAGHSPPAAA